MSDMRVILASGLFLFASLMPASAQTTLYVNATTGNDSVSRASNSAATPWRSIGRAAWGSTNRSAPSSAEAAQAGDTVNVAGGTYDFSGTVVDRFTPVYNTVNNGTVANPITFACIGNCTLAAPSAYSPVIGSSGRNYVKWFADVTLGHSWQIQCYGLVGGTPPSTSVRTKSDAGPVVCHASTGCWIEGAVIDGGRGIDYVDNWNAIRLENCTSSTIRNNTAANFTRDISVGITNHNQSIITLYGSLNSLIENNIGTNAGAGVYFKDTSTTNPQRGDIVRFNRFDTVNEVIAFSIITSEDRNFVYQNVGTNGRLGLAVVGGGLSNDWIFNNTFYRMTVSAIALNTNGSGGRIWNNICLECDTIITISAGSMVPETVADLEHNVYFGYRQFYVGANGVQ